MCGCRRHSSTSHPAPVAVVAVLLLLPQQQVACAKGWQGVPLLLQPFPHQRCWPWGAINAAGAAQANY